MSQVVFAVTRDGGAATHLGVGTRDAARRPAEHRVAPQSVTRTLLRRAGVGKLL